MGWIRIRKSKNFVARSGINHYGSYNTANKAKKQMKELT